MKRKNSVVVTMNPDQRCVLSAAIDLLEDLRTVCAPKIDEATVESLRAIFDALDCDERTLGIELTSKEHRICSIAVRYASLYLSGEHQHFYFPISENVDRVLNEFEPFVHGLNALFPG